MTKFLSKIFLSGILLSSISGYCQEGTVTNINVGISTKDNSATTTVRLAEDYEQSLDLNIGTTNWTKDTDLPGPGYSLVGNEIVYDDPNDDTQGIIVADKDSSGKWTAKGNYQFNNAILDLNNQILTLAEGKKITIESQGTLKSGTINLLGNNTVKFKPGSKAGEVGTENNPTKEIIIQSNGNDSNIDLTDYISLNKTGTINNPDGNKLYLCLRGKQEIKIFDNINNKNAIIDSFDKYSGVTLFSNIKTEKLADDTNNCPIFNVPYSYNISSQNGEQSQLDSFPTKLLSDYMNNTIGIKTIKLDKIFDNTKTCDIKFKFGDYDSMQGMLQGLVTTINNGFDENDQTSKVNVDADSFIHYNNNIDVLKLDRTSNHANIKVSDYELKISKENETFDFNNIEVKTIYEKSVNTDSSGTKTIKNANNTKYIPDNNSTGDIKFENSSVTINGGDSSEMSKTINNLNLKESTITLKGYLNLNGLSVSSDEEVQCQESVKNTCVNIASNSTIILGSKKNQTKPEDKNLTEPEKQSTPESEQNPESPETQPDESNQETPNE